MAWSRFESKSLQPGDIELLESHPSYKLKMAWRVDLSLRASSPATWSCSRAIHPTISRWRGSDSSLRASSLATRSCLRVIQSTNRGSSIIWRECGQRKVNGTSNSVCYKNIK
jgi:hypothetical protein